jgi:hypothetical protein
MTQEKNDDTNNDSIDDDMRGYPPLPKTPPDKEEKIQKNQIATRSTQDKTTNHHTESGSARKDT